MSAHVTQTGKSTQCVKLWEESINHRCYRLQNDWQTQGEQHEGISMKFPASARRPGQQSLLPPFQPIVNQPLLRQMGELSMTVRFLETQKGTASSLWEEYIPVGELIKCCCYQNNWHNAVQTTISWFPASWSWSSNANFLLQCNCRASTMLVSGRWLITDHTD